LICILNKIFPIFHWEQAAPTRYKDRTGSPCSWHSVCGCPRLDTNCPRG